MTLDKYGRVVCLTCACFHSKIYQLSPGVGGWDQEQGVGFKIKVMKNGKTQEALYMYFFAKRLSAGAMGSAPGFQGQACLFFSK